MSPMPDRGPLLRPQYHKGIEIMVNSHCPDSVDQWAVLWRTPSPITPGKSTIYRNLRMGIHQNRWVTVYPWLQEHCLISTGIPLSCCKPVLLKPTIPAIEHAVLGRREKVEILVLHIVTPSIFSRLTVLPPLVNT